MPFLVMSTERDAENTTGASDRVASDRVARRARVRAAEGPRYGRGSGYERAAESPDPSASDDPSRRSRVHSVLSALPVIMLMSGLYFYYSGESAQNAGAPIRAESVDAHGTFEGLSTVKSGGEGRHYLWFDDGVRTRGARILPVQRDALAGLAPGDELRLGLAPTVGGSGTLWVWRVERDDIVLLDDSVRLH